MNLPNLGLSAVFTLLLSTPLHAQAGCELPALAHQQRDVATIQRLESAWSIAFYQGDTTLERCLLAPDFAEVLRNGEVKTLADEFQFALKNRGRNLPIPPLPTAVVLLHGNVATACGTVDGKAGRTRYADFYVWEGGAWHAFFAQQTAVVGDGA